MSEPLLLGTQNVPRIETILHRIGTLLAEQPESFRTYHNGCQEIRREMWWDEENGRVANVIRLAESTMYWEGSELGRQLGVYLQVVDASLRFALREKRREHWLDPKSVERALRKGDLSEASLMRMVGVLDHRDREAANQLLRTAFTMLKRVLALYEADAERNTAAIQQMGWEGRVSRSRITERIGLLELSLKPLANLLDSLEFDRVTVEGHRYPQSRQEWREFESDVAVHLGELGLPKKRIVELFEKDSHKPGADRTRINKNIRRKRSRT